MEVDQEWWERKRLRDNNRTAVTQIKCQWQRDEVNLVNHRSPRWLYWWSVMRWYWSVGSDVTDRDTVWCLQSEQCCCLFTPSTCLGYCLLKFYTLKKMHNHWWIRCHVKVSQPLGIFTILLLELKVILNHIK